MGTPRVLEFRTISSGVAVRYLPTTDEIELSGHFDGVTADRRNIEGGRVNLAEFLDALNITEADVRRARRVLAAKVAK